MCPMTHKASLVMGRLQLDKKWNLHWILFPVVWLPWWLNMSCVCCFLEKEVTHALSEILIQFCIKDRGCNTPFQMVHRPVTGLTPQLLVDLTASSGIENHDHKIMSGLHPNPQAIHLHIIKHYKHEFVTWLNIITPTSVFKWNHKPNLCIGLSCTWLLNCFPCIDWMEVVW